MHPETCVEFPPFRLDLASQELWRDSERLPLRGKPFAVLAYLATHPARLVLREELVRAVWPDTHVGDGLLRGYVRELRTILGDEAAAPRFIETVARRGYRFVAAVRNRGARGAAGSGSAPHPKLPQATVVGRDAELAQLEGWFEDARAGARRVVFVTGEAGIGKTTLVDAFLRAAEAGGVRTARGQCVEHFGAGEAYLPLLEALGRLGALPGSQDVIAVLARHAPTWLVELPALIADAELEAVRRRVQGATRERMLRELAEAVEVLTAVEPLLLVLEDLQWSDHSTLDLLSSLARRREPARLLVIGTYRAPDVARGAHPLAAIAQELKVHGLCADLALRPLGVDAVAEYLAARFPEEELAHFGRSIHQATEGNPLFVVNLVDYWTSRGVLVEHWNPDAQLTAVGTGVPDTLRQMIERQLDRLEPEARRVLEAASVVGSEFSTAAVAAALEQREDHVEERCEELAGRGLFLRPSGVDALAAGTVAGRYAFLHGLYRQVLYQALSPTRRARLHRRIGSWHESAYGALVHEHAAELAVHFEQGHDPARAVHHLEAAARTAMRRQAYHEASALLGRALELLAGLPPSEDASRREFSLRMALGASLLTTRGYAAPEVQRAYARAHELSGHMEAGPQLFFALAGLFRFFLVRGDLALARELSEELLRLADAGDSVLPAVAHSLAGLPLLAVAELAAARAQLERGVALYDFERHSALAREHGDDPGITALAFLAITLWFAGHPDRALERVGEAKALAERLGTPYSMAFALDFCAWIHGRRGEAALSQASCDALLAIAAEQGFTFFHAEGTILRGWALADQGRLDAGIEQMCQGLAAYRATGAEMGRPSHLALLAEAYARAQRPEEGLRAVGEALAAVSVTGECSYEADLHRLKGELLHQLGARGRRGAALGAEARACLQRAVAIARRQGARSLELRAASSLVRLDRNRRADTQARRGLRDALAGFTEGFDTADLVAARSLLDAVPVAGG